MRGAIIPAALTAQILTTGFWELMLLLWDKPKTVEAAGLSGLGTGSVLLLLLLEARLHLRV